ncbi:MAG: potassium/proton antiporter [Nitrospirota bacterium]
MNFPSFEFILFAVAALILLNIISSTIASRLGIPALVIFLTIGMLAGSDGPGGIHFDDPTLVQSVGIVALSFILFAGGVDTNWKSVRPVLWQGLSLATLGVVITATLVGVFVYYVLDFTFFEAMLLGAIVSSTDAAAVFAVLRSHKVSLKGTLRPLLELESGSNDPMAVFLTTGMIMLILNKNAGIENLAVMLIWQMTVGALLGFAIGKGSIYLINKIKLEYDGLYSVLTLALVLFNYGLTTMVLGNGFLSVYVAGLVMGNSVFAKKKSLIRFHDGLAWLMQITMFLILGLQVYPSHLVPVIPVGLLAAAVLMLVARPVAVFLALLFARVTVMRKVMISWVGLRGAVPIVLGTFPLVAGLEKADMIFNIVFFVVITSALLQGSTVALVARWLKLDAPLAARFRSPFELEPGEHVQGEPVEIEIGADSPAAGVQIIDLGLPPGALILFIERDSKYIIPSGATGLRIGDRLHMIVKSELIPSVMLLLGKNRVAL